MGELPARRDGRRRRRHLNLHLHSKMKMLLQALIPKMIVYHSTCLLLPNAAAFLPSCRSIWHTSHRIVPTHWLNQGTSDEFYAFAQEREFPGRDSGECLLPTHSQCNFFMSVGSTMHNTSYHCAEHCRKAAHTHKSYLSYQTMDEELLSSSNILLQTHFLPKPLLHFPALVVEI